MRLGLCGWSASGKSTVFDVLTGGQKHPHVPGKTRLGVCHVPDERVDFLAGIMKPKKVTYASVEYVDLPGLLAGPHAHDVNPATLSDVRQTDALVAVVRAFEDDTVGCPFGDVNPVRDFERLRDELVFADLEVVDRRIKRLEKDVTRPTPHQKEDRLELECQKRIRKALEEGAGVAAVDFSEAEEKALRGFRFLSAKPMLVLLNRGEESVGREPAWREEDFGCPVVWMFAKLELELDELGEDDQSVFMEEMGLDHLAAPEVVSKGYEMLDLISFLTGTGPKEVRAWTIPRGTTAIEAAGAIHSDIQRGFIRAEVTAFEDFRALGSFKEARAKGKLRLEGKDYVVQDGDIMEFRFSV